MKPYMYQYFVLFTNFIHGAFVENTMCMMSFVGTQAAQSYPVLLIYYVISLYK